MKPKVHGYYCSCPQVKNIAQLNWEQKFDQLSTMVTCWGCQRTFWIKRNVLRLIIEPILGTRPPNVLKTTPNALQTTPLARQWCHGLTLLWIQLSSHSHSQPFQMPFGTLGKLPWLITGLASPSSNRCHLVQNT